MSSDWWSRKLSNNPAPSHTPQRTSVPPVAPPVRIGTQVRMPAPVEPPQETAVANLSPNEEIHMGDAIRMWKGGEAARKEGNMYCPECGSHNVFSRVARGGNTTIQGKSPAPRCFECGWTGLYTQADQTNWAQ